MILPKDRDPRFITIRRGGSLTDHHHHLPGLWAADRAEHVLHFFEAIKPSDLRPRLAIEQIRAWTRGEIKMMECRAAGGHAMAAARDLKGAARNAAYAAGQAAVVAHVAAHELGAAAYAIKAAKASVEKSKMDEMGQKKCQPSARRICRVLSYALNPGSITMLIPKPAQLIGIKFLSLFGLF